MAPEQFEDSSKVDTRADIWAMGVMLYEASCGVLPFPGSSVPEVVRAVFHTEPAPACSMVEGMPGSLDRLIMRCLRKNREERFANGGELLAALADAAGETGREEIPVLEVPEMNLKEKGIDVTAPITSSRMETKPESSTERERPSEDNVPTVREDAVPSGTQESWGTGQWSPDGPRRRRKTAVAVLSAVALVLVAGAIALWQLALPPDRGAGAGGSTTESGQATEFSEVSKGAVEEQSGQEGGKNGVTGTAASGGGSEASGAGSTSEEDMPLSDLPRLASLQLGQLCKAVPTSLAEKVISARLLAGWRGKRLSLLSPERLRQLGLTPQDLDNFSEVRKANTLVRTVDEEAIRGSVRQFSREPLSKAGLEELAAKLDASPDLAHYVEAKSGFMCESLPLSARGQDVGKLVSALSADFSPDKRLFSNLDATHGSDPYILAETSARAVCCLLSTGALRL